jgi:hypothetical protein
MRNFDPIITALLLAITVALGWYLRDRFAALEKRLDRHDDRFDAQDERIDGLTQDVAALKTAVAAIQGRLDEISRELIGLRSDILQIALAVGARARPETA